MKSFSLIVAESKHNLSNAKDSKLFQQTQTKQHKVQTMYNQWEKAHNHVNTSMKDLGQNIRVDHYERHEEWNRRNITESNEQNSQRPKHIITQTADCCHHSNLFRIQTRMCKAPTLTRCSSAYKEQVRLRMISLFK